MLLVAKNLMDGYTQLSVAVPALGVEAVAAGSSLQQPMSRAASELGSFVPSFQSVGSPRATL